MEFLASAFSSLISVFVLAVFVAGVMKLFQIHTVLTEIKESVRAGASFSASPSTSMRVPAPRPSVETVPTTAALHEMGSGEDMLRHLDAQIKLDKLTAVHQPNND